MEAVLQVKNGVVAISGGRLGKLFADQLHEIAKRSGHLSDYIGRYRSKFACRALFVESPIDIEHVIGMGFNTLFIPEEYACPELIHEYLKRGLDVSLVLNSGKLPSPADPVFAERLHEHLRKSMEPYQADRPSVFWESSWAGVLRNSPKAREYTDLDLLQLEMKHLEDTILPGTRLYYYLPIRADAPAHFWETSFHRLCQEASSSTVLVFDCCVGSSAHPLWSALRKTYDMGSTPLLPLLTINTAQIFSLFDAAEWLLHAAHRHSMAGLCLSEFSNGSLLQKGFLHAAAYFLWTGRSPEAFLASWKLAHFGNEEEGECLALIRLASKYLHIKDKRSLDFAASCFKEAARLNELNKGRWKEEISLLINSFIQGVSN